jgi:ribose transport system ATP-binding protein
VRDASIIIMDEPTAALTDNEVRSLFAAIRELKTHGIGIIYISHRLDEVFEICDRVTVMRDGHHIQTQPTAELSRERLIELMVGRKLEGEFPKRNVAIGELRLEVRGLSREGVVRDVSFGVRRGEVVTITGLVGAGRTELARLIFGADRMDTGEIWLDGRKLEIRSPQDAIAEGISLLTEDRKAQGLVLGLSVRENFGLPNLRRFSRMGFVSRRKERGAFGKYRDLLNIRLANVEQEARSLSGGNQQKVVLAKWLQSNSEVLIFDEPTRGIDVGAKVEIYELVNSLAAAGKAVLMISSELPEVLGMSDRVLIMREGRLVGEIADVKSATQERIMALAAR